MHARWVTGLAAALCGLSLAQEGVTLQGVVEDPTKAPIPKAEVQIRNRATREKRTVLTDENGRFSLGDLPQGDYKLEAEAPGFDKGELELKVGSTAPKPLRIQLMLGAQKQQVTVKDQSDEVREVGANPDIARVGEHLLSSLPVRLNDLLAIPSLFFDPAVTGFGGAQIIVDGEEATNLDYPAMGVKRVYVNRNPYSAEFARPGRGRIEVTTKDGSRRHHHRTGAVTIQNSALNARNVFASMRPVTQRTMLEGAMEGPLGSRTRFLTAAQYLRYNDSALVTAETPPGRVVENVPAPFRDLRLSARLDLQPAPAHAVRGSYKYNDKSSRNLGVGGFNLRERGYNEDVREHKLSISETAAFSSDFTNEFRVSLSDERQGLASVLDRPAIVVLDAFSSGGAQRSNLLRERSVQLHDIVGASLGRHTVRFGVEARLRSFDASDATNFGGTFTFSSLRAFQENRPFLYEVNRGNPAVAFRQNEFASFFQDDFRIRPDLNIQLGLRHQVQSNLSDYNNLAPRIALAYSPGRRRTVFTAGSGVFYERQSMRLEQNALLYDDERIQRAVVHNPGFPSAPPPDSALPPSVMRLAPDIVTPYLIQTSAGVEHKIGAGRGYVALEFMNVRGLKLHRLRNVNAPLPGTRLRPDPRFVNINQFESSGQMDGQSMRIMATLPSTQNLEFQAQYKLSRTRDDTGGAFSLPANNYDLRPEYGRADFDRRHDFVFLGIYRLPRRTRLGVIAHVASGMPYNITTGSDDNGDTVANDRPPGGLRNTGQGPGFAGLDVRLSKRLRFGGDRHRPEMEVRVDAFNVLNRVNFTHYIGTLSSPFFGRANAALPARQVQLSLKLEF